MHRHVASFPQVGAEANGYGGATLEDQFKLLLDDGLSPVIINLFAAESEAGLFVQTARLVQAGEGREVDAPAGRLPAETDGLCHQTFAQSAMLTCR